MFKALLSVGRRGMEEVVRFFSAPCPHFHQMRVLPVALPVCLGVPVPPLFCRLIPRTCRYPVTGSRGATVGTVTDVLTAPCRQAADPPLLLQEGACRAVVYRSSLPRCRGCGGAGG